MNSDMIQTADMLDILFEHRNKEYGAYVLRRGYNGRMLKAMYTIPALVALFFLLNYWAQHSKESKGAFIGYITDSVMLSNVEQPMPELPKPKLLVQPPKQVATIKNTPPVIVPPDVVTDPPPTIEQLQKETAAIGTENKEGDVPVSAASPPATETTGTGTVPAEPPAKEQGPLAVAEKMPQFPGGIEGLRRFLGRNLRVPEEALEAGQRVRVPIRFVVGKDSVLQNLEFLGPTDEAFKKEILRVVGKMPKWEPGSQNGRAVAVYFSIPIIFEISE